MLDWAPRSFSGPVVSRSAKASFSPTELAGVTATVGSCCDSDEPDATSGSTSVASASKNSATSTTFWSPVVAIAAAGGTVATVRATVVDAATSGLSARDRSEGTVRDLETEAAGAGRSERWLRFRNLGFKPSSARAEGPSP